MARGVRDSYKALGIEFKYQPRVVAHAVERQPMRDQPKELNNFALRDGAPPPIINVTDPTGPTHFTQHKRPARSSVPVLPTEYAPKYSPNEIEFTNGCLDNGDISDIDMDEAEERGVVRRNESAATRVDSERGGRTTKKRAASGPNESSINDRSRKLKRSKRSGLASRRFPLDKIDDRERTLLRGINTKYVLGADQSRDYQQKRKLAHNFLRNSDAETEYESLPNILEISSQPENSDALKEVKCVTASSLTEKAGGDSVDQRVKRRLDIADNNKRSYVDADHVTVVYPEMKGKDVPEDVEKRLKQTHINFVMASRDPNAIYLPNADEESGLEPIAHYLVITEAELNGRWDGLLPKGVGAIVIPGDKDSGINHRRFAAVAAARDIIDERAADVVTMQDDNIKNIKGYAETINQLKYLHGSGAPKRFSEPEHHLFTFPNRNQRDVTTFSSGKLIAMDADLLRLFRPIGDSSEEKSVSLTRLVPPKNLFYNDIWLLCALKAVPAERQSSIELGIGGDLYKSAAQQHASLDNLTRKSEVPADAWVQLDLEKAGCIDAGDAHLLDKLKRHITGCTESIKRCAIKLDQELEERVFNRPMSDLMKIAEEKGAVRKVAAVKGLRDYQKFVTEIFNKKIKKITYSEKGSTHMALVMATGTGKTVTFLDTASYYLSLDMSCFRSDKKLSQNALVVTSRIENAKDIYAKAKTMPELTNKVVLICSDDAALDSEVLIRSKTLADDKLLVIAVRNSIDDALKRKEDLLDNFGMFLFDESHQYNDDFMEKFKQCRERSDQHLLFLQASATPNIEHLRPQYLGNRLYIANYKAEVAQARGVIRSVNHRFMNSDTVRVINGRSTVQAASKLVVNEILSRINRTEEFKEIGSRTVCYVKSKDLADACVRHLKTEANLINADIFTSGYHSSNSHINDTFDRFCDPLKPGEKRILFAVNMFKEAIDPPDGVDFLFQMQTEDLTTECRTQMRGRAYRKRAGCESPAYFYDYSRPTTEPFFEDLDAYRTFDYTAPVEVVMQSLGDQTCRWELEILSN